MQASPNETPVWHGTTILTVRKGGKVVIDMKIAGRLHGNVDARMPGQEIKHVVEEADPGRDAGHAGAIEVHRNLDVGLLGLALDGGIAHEMGFP